MTKLQFRKIQKLLSTLINKIEKEAMDRGRDISSDDFQEAILELKKKFLAEKGITLEQYEELKEQFAEETGKLKTAFLVNKDDVDLELGQKIKEITDSFNQIIEELKITIQGQKQEIVELKNRKPDIFNKIVKEIIKEKPQIIETKEIIKELDEARLNETREDLLKLQSDFTDLWEKIKNIKTSDTDGLSIQYKELEDKFNFLQKNVDWSLTKLKKHTLAGQEWNSAVSDQRYYTKGEAQRIITVSATSPSSPYLNQLWIDTT